MKDVMYERAYYHCRHCHAGHSPSDAEFRIQQHQSPAANEIISLAGLLEPFEEAAHRTLSRLSGISVSASTVQRTTERVGDDVARRRGEGETFGPETPWDWNRDSQGKTLAYVGLDATGVRQQGPHAEQAEGRMPWVGVVFNPQPTHEQQRRRRIWDSRAVSGLMSLRDIGRQLRRECQAVGVSRAERVIALTDGGAGLENCLLDVLGGLSQETIFILDFWHAADHLRAFAAEWTSDDETRQPQLAAWCHRLKHEGGQALLSELEALDLSRASPPARESHRLLTGYIRGNLHRMNYPQYIARGWQIGSGKVESSCKSVVAARLKGPGMRWHERGTTALCQLRALYKSQPQCWNQYWKSTTFT
jgi:hypothetical protein